MSEAKNIGGLIVSRFKTREDKFLERLDKEMERHTTSPQYPEPTRILPNGCREWTFKE